MEASNLQILKTTGKKVILRRQSSTKHNFPVGTIMTLKYMTEITK